MAMCHTKGMRNALIALMCATGFGSGPAGRSTLPSRDASKQAPRCQIITTTSVVIAPTTVRDRNGDFVDGLQLQDFELYDNNKLQKITADVRDEPLSLVVAVQRSSNLTEILPKIQSIGSMLERSDRRPGWRSRRDWFRSSHSSDAGFHQRNRQNFRSHEEDDAGQRRTRGGRCTWMPPFAC